MKKLIVIAVSAIMVLSLVACGNYAAVNEGTAQAGEGLGGNPVQIPNPFVDCSTIDDAQKLAGFDLTVPKIMPEGYCESAIRAIDSRMIEIVFTKGANEIRIRKSTGCDDISGDYNVYNETNTTTVGDVQLTKKGNDGKVNVATWVQGNYAFAITANPGGAGVDSTVISDMANNIQ